MNEECTEMLSGTSRTVANFHVSQETTKGFYPSKHTTNSEAQVHDWSFIHLLFWLSKTKGLPPPWMQALCKPTPVLVSGMQTLRLTHLVAQHFVIRSSHHEPLPEHRAMQKAVQHGINVSIPVVSGRTVRGSCCTIPS